MQTSDDTARLPDFTPFGVSVAQARSTLREARGRCLVAHHEGAPEFYTPLSYRDVRNAAKDWQIFRSAPSMMGGRYRTGPRRRRSSSTRPSTPPGGVCSRARPTPPPPAGSSPWSAPTPGS